MPFFRKVNSIPDFSSAKPNLNTSRSRLHGAKGSSSRLQHLARLVATKSRPSYRS